MFRHTHHAADHHGHRHHFAGRGGRHGFGHGHGHGGWGHHADEERGGRRRRVFDSGELRLVLLKLIAEQPRHGYDLIRAIEELTGGTYAPSPGVVYPMLTLLQDMGQIEETRSEGSRKSFAITAEGTEELERRKPEVESLLARLQHMASARQRTDGGPIRRAMENLRSALRYRFDRDELDPDTLHKAAAILDEAAQKIERL